MQGEPRRVDREGCLRIALHDEQMAAQAKTVRAKSDYLEAAAHARHVANNAELRADGFYWYTPRSATD